MFVFIPGWFLYFIIAFKMRSLILSQIGSEAVYSEIFRVLTILKKKVFKTSAVSLPVLMILS